MIVSQLNQDGYFTAAVEADESPLENGVFLIPGGAVDAPPPEIPEGKRAKWVRGEWKFETLPAEPPPEPEPEPEPLTLAKAKLIKLGELGAWIAQQTAVLKWEGAIYQTDDLARDRLMASLQMHQVGARPDPSPWRTLDNSMVDLSGEALTELCKAVYLHHQEITLASFEFKDQIEALTAIEAVQGFTFD